jgi:hypothetical protein
MIISPAWCRDFAADTAKQLAQTVNLIHVSSPMLLTLL